MVSLECLENMATNIANYKGAYSQKEYQKIFLDLVITELLPLSKLLTKAGLYGGTVTVVFRDARIELSGIEGDTDIFFHIYSNVEYYCTYVGVNGFSEWDWDSHYTEETAKVVCEELEELFVNNFEEIKRLVYEEVYNILRQTCEKYALKY